MYVFSVLLSLIFLVLSILHLNWALGGKWGLNAALPSNPDGEKLFKPTKGLTLLVAIVLLLISLNYFINPEPGNPKNWIFSYSRIIIPVIFLVRAIGDFKFVGFFKKVKGTKFAEMDTKYYSPLCLIIAILGLAVRFV